MRLNFKNFEEPSRNWRRRKTRGDFPSIVEGRQPVVVVVVDSERGRFANINYIDETSIIPWTINYATGARRFFSRYECRVGIHEASRCDRSNNTRGTSPEFRSIDRKGKRTRNNNERRRAECHDEPASGNFCDPRWLRSMTWDDLDGDYVLITDKNQLR